MKKKEDLESILEVDVNNHTGKEINIKTTTGIKPRYNYPCIQK